MAGRSRTTAASRWMREWGWIVLVVVVVMAASAVYVGRLRLSDIPDRAIGYSPPAPEIGVPRPKSIEYAVIGSEGASARVSYLGADGRARDAVVTLPWRKVVMSQQFVTSVGVLAQTSGSNSLSCTVTVNGTRQSAERGTGRNGNTAVNCAVPVA